MRTGRLIEAMQSVIAPLQQIAHRAIHRTRIEAAFLPHPVQYCDLLIDWVFGLLIQPFFDAALDKHRVTSVFGNAKPLLR